MNNLLKLSGKRFIQDSRHSGMGPASLPKNSSIALEELKCLLDELVQVEHFWKNNKFVDGALVSVYYNNIIAKSNRIQEILKKDSKTFPNDSVVGAKFNAEQTKHIITHFVSNGTLAKSVKTVQRAVKLFEEVFSGGSMSQKDFDNSDLFERFPYEKYGVPKTVFRAVLRDAYYVESFGIERADKDVLNSSIITFYRTSENIITTLGKLGIPVGKEDLLNETTVFLDRSYIDLLFDHASYLVAMAVEDFSRLSHEEFLPSDIKNPGQIPDPDNEPVIGVIDTLFYEGAYFHKWVEYHDEISPDIKKESEDYKHGTAVSSLIVDGAALNPRLDDGCGRFRVRHFGVSQDSGFNSFVIIKAIKEIIKQNLDIKVWNLSLGSNVEIRDNFISAEADTLDEIQFEYDVLFVIAGTNQRSNMTKRKKIGSPADSINSVVVNSVDFKNQPASYSRKGIVLSFFTKPDISYYGGGNGDFINVIEPTGLAKVSGTSYAAPFIARKLAYLIQVIGLKREEAKALLIDSALGWNSRPTFENLALTGNGVVPITMDEILSIPEDEIKFIVSDISEKYDSYNFDFPVPINKGKHPFVAKATMCYFPHCERKQGVDYTNTELNLTFGRLKLKPNTKGELVEGIDPINNDTQNSDFDEVPYLKEKDRRKFFRKWDNVKHIGEKFNSLKRAKSIFNAENPQWGMSVKTLERLKQRDGEGIHFGVVVTLKEINGVNRIDDFIRQASLRGWIVNQLNAENQVEVYNQMAEDIEFE